MGSRATWISAAIISGIIIAGLASDFVFPLFGCPIKGNISYTTGEKIYHVPGQEFYSRTKINWFRGERWFCSERTAIEAGWRKSKR